MPDKRKDDEVEKGAAKGGGSKAAYYARLRERMGEEGSGVDWEGDDEEGRYGALLKHDDRERELFGSYRDSNQKLGDLFMKNPKFAAMMSDVMKGSDPSVAFVKFFGRDALDASDDDEKMQMITEANQEYLNRVSESEELRKRQEENLEKSGAEMEAFQTEKGLGDEEFAKFVDAVYNVVEQGLEGLIGRDFLEIFWRGLNYEADLQDAANAGRVEARNEKIELANRTRQGDGVPDLHGGKSGGDVEAGVQPRRRSFYS